MAKTKKRCSCCGIEWRLVAFHNDKSKRDGKSSWCKVCMRMGSKSTSELDELIVGVVEELSPSYKRVFPVAVQASIGLNVSEEWIRRRMAMLSKRGQIVRLGQRSGYLSIQTWLRRAEHYAVTA